VEQEDCWTQLELGNQDQIQYFQQLHQQVAVVVEVW
jgi:hypothetical protein